MRRNTHRLPLTLLAASALTVIVAATVKATILVDGTGIIDQVMSSLYSTGATVEFRSTHSLGLKRTGFYDPERMGHHGGFLQSGDTYMVWLDGLPYNHCFGRYDYRNPDIGWIR